MTLNTSTVQHWNSGHPISLERVLNTSRLFEDLAARDIDVVAVQPLFDNITLSRLGAWPKPRKDLISIQQQSQSVSWAQYVGETANKSAALLEVCSIVAIEGDVEVLTTPSVCRTDCSICVWRWLHWPRQRSALRLSSHVFDQGSLCGWRQLNLH